jgi:hypothetical protein
MDELKARTVPVDVFPWWQTVIIALLVYIIVWSALRALAPSRQYEKDMNVLRSMCSGCALMTSTLVFWVLWWVA